MAVQRCTRRSVNSKHAEQRCAREPMDLEFHFSKNNYFNNVHVQHLNWNTDKTPCMDIRREYLLHQGYTHDRNLLMYQATSFKMG